MDKAVEMLDKMVEAIKSLAVQHGDSAMQVTLEVARLKAIQVLVDNGMQMLLGIVLAIAAYKLFNKCREAYNDSSADEIGWFIGGCTTTIISAIMLLESGSKLITMKYWIGAHNPSMYLAMELLDKVVK